jgi:hypothetical protein
MAPNDIAFAAAAAAFEMLLRASRARDISLITSAHPINGEQEAALSFGFMLAVGLATESVLEGVDLDMKSVAATCAVTFLPTHSPLEQAHIGSTASLTASNILVSSPQFRDTLRQVAVIIVRDTPETMAIGPQLLRDGTPVEQLLAPMLDSLLVAKVNAA